MTNHQHSRRRQGRVRARWLAIPLAFGLVAAACGDDDDTAETQPPGTSEGTEPGGTEPGGTEPGDTTPAGGGLLGELQDKGSVTIGIANEVPYGYEDDGEATGEAPAVARAVLAELGIDEINFEVVNFDGLIPGIQAGRYDMIAAGMFINPERAEEILFSDPDYCGYTAFAVAEGNPDNLTDFQSVIDAGINLGVLGGAVEHDYALDSGVPKGNVTTFPDTPSLVDGLTSGRIDAFSLTDATVETQTRNLDGFESSEPFVPVIDGEEQLGCGGFGFTDQGFRDAFNEILVEMKENDEIYPIIKEFGFSEEAAERAKEFTAEDLSS